MHFQGRWTGLLHARIRVTCTIHISPLWGNRNRDVVLCGLCCTVYVGPQRLYHGRWTASKCRFPMISCTCSSSVESKLIVIISSLRSWFIICNYSTARTNAPPSKLLVSRTVSAKDSKPNCNLQTCSPCKNYTIKVADHVKARSVLTQTYVCRQWFP